MVESLSANRESPFNYGFHDWGFTLTALQHSFLVDGVVTFPESDLVTFSLDVLRPVTICGVTVRCDGRIQANEFDSAIGSTFSTVLLQVRQGADTHAVHKIALRFDQGTRPFLLHLGCVSTHLLLSKFLTSCKKRSLVK
jgi:hypothetical protein